ncbi:hypothetical protein TEA_009691 [Camellia sinensis var. sinensis]|uniref:BUB1 N-terminal domain-containing protein n=1 Tax=Camellia sinensis var. sinensis TaxID=542762 RepID=A0A4S4EII9_CAMSN|nr:hypothetical protein TEA_009691 [Camellia sinensis var. sinensis]
MDLTGSLSSDILSLSELQYLDLSNNKGLTGTLPSLIGNLNQLTTLILIGCSFFGPIPDSIGSLQQLVFLALNANNFSGPIPPSIGNLSNLSWLDLTENQLNGTIPVSSGSTTGLDMLVKARHLSIKKSIDGLSSADCNGTDLDELISNCIKIFKNDARYQNDVRFLKIWFLYMDSSPDFESIFRVMEQNKICRSNSLLYESYALFLEAKGKFADAFMAYQLGISRNAEPLERLKKAQALFRDRMSEIVNAGSHEKGFLGTAKGQGLRKRGCWLVGRGWEGVSAGGQGLGRIFDWLGEEEKGYWLVDGGWKGVSVVVG